MANMNIVSPTAAKIYAAWLRQGQSEAPRTYLGASIIGHHCDMYLWLMFRNVVKEAFDGRMYRLFDRGKREEAVFCDDLRRIGCEVKEFDANGNQISVSALGGHFGGHLDGIVRGLDEAPKQWHDVEFKTHSHASFVKLCKEGVKKAKPMHYDQMTVYMGLTGLGAALYMAVDKDTDDLWCERVKFDKAHFDTVMARAKHIIDTTNPDRCATRRDDYRCKMCPCASVCWHDAEQFIDPLVPLSCKTCCHATAVTDGTGAKWTCRLGHDCPSKGCPEHLILPVFVNGTLVEGDERGILYEYEDENGKTNGITIGLRGLPETEAQKIGPRCARDVQTIRDAFPGAKVVKANTLKAKYADHSKFEVYFNGSTDELARWIEKNPIANYEKPIRTERDEDGTVYCEYPPSTLVTVKDSTATVIFERPTF